MTAPVADGDEVLVVQCAYCGRDCSDGPGSLETRFVDTVNLTPDMLMFELTPFHFGQGLIEMDMAVDWCGRECFGRWLWRAVAMLQSARRAA